MARLSAPQPLLRHSGSVPSPEDGFPKARGMKRRWHVFLGPTNSGKTYQAMQRLLHAPSGIYLAPLRLMALEAYDTLVAQGLNCCLQTGEEHQVHGEGPVTHVAATMESLDPNRAWDVAVIDEAQMLGDPDRGWAWTRALLGVAAQTVCVCAAPEAEMSLRALAAHLGEEIEVHVLARENPLRIKEKPLQTKELTKGDALIGFSRSMVLAYRALLRQHGKTVACLYGDLGPEVRRREAARFASGEADILVATDAIGMGLNLPIRRVVFSALRKFDGQKERLLELSEMKQIGGRAGRRGFHEKGEVRVLHGLSFGPLAKGLDRTSEPVTCRWPIQPRPEDLLALAQSTGIMQVPQLLARWLQLAKPLEAIWDLKPARAWMHSPWTVTLATRASLDLQLAYGGCPVRDTISDTVLEWLARHRQGHHVSLPVAPVKGNLAKYEEDSLARLERHAHLLTAYRWLSRRFPEIYSSGAALEAQRTEIHGWIAQALAQAGLVRLCQECGTRLKMDAIQKGHRKCQDCFDARHRHEDFGYGDFY